MARERKDLSTNFTAMASPCVVLVDSSDSLLGEAVGDLVKSEALRIEMKFSRYRPSVVTHINEHAGDAVLVDEESADLLDYAALCYRLSEGLFDITSGVLRRVWKFDGTGTLPTSARVQQALEFVGWHRVRWNRPVLQLAPGMEIDFGGIGKEYAVDRALALVQKRTPVPVLVNLGGDLRVTGLRHDGAPWRVVIEDVDRLGSSAGLLELSHGAIATSGNTHRFLEKDGIRYGHVLNPKSGWPIDEAPRSITVHADTCTEAGQLAKLALLRGAGAEQFLEFEQVRAWCIR
ncbi:MAG: FAD:protein FMN transferase [Gammaproteobacteria bacterium]